MSEALARDDRFRVVALLGSGATASVYDAVDRSTNERVALKVLHPHLAGHPASARAFLREAEIVRGVAHPGLCGLVAYGDGSTAARSWVAWQYVAGVSLAEEVRASGPLDVGPALDLVAQLLRALAALHAAGIVHRDISPANVLLDRDPRGRVRDVRLIDFGLAAPAGESTRGGDVLRSSDGDGIVGNVSYASPEQLRGEAVGFAGDLYQVAGVLYFSLVGTPPFARASVDDTVQAHLTALPPTASVSVPGVPLEVDRLIVRAMLKEPTERFADAAAMLAAIEAVTRGSRPPLASHDTGRVPRPMPMSAPTRVIASERSVPHEPMHAPGPRSTSPWLWVVACAALAVVVAVTAVAASPARSGSAVAPPASSPVEETVETPAPTAATAPPVVSAEPTAASGAANVRVPDVGGMTLVAATEALRRVGLVTGVVTEQDGSSPAQTVLSAQTSAGSDVQAGSAIDLVVASGWNRVPDVMTWAEQDATGLLMASGYVVVVAREARSGVPGSTVAMEPGVSARLPLGSTVKIIVATTPVSTPPSTPRPSPSASPSPTATT